MKRQIHICLLLISVISIFAGIAEIVICLIEGKEINWQLPIILIGIGTGLPIFIYPFWESAADNPELDYDENDLSGCECTILHPDRLTMEWKLIT